MVKFDTTDEEKEIMRRIAERAEARPDMLGGKYKRMNLLMDLSATHSNGCPLDFQKLLDFPEVDFWHDVLGIHRFIDRETGKLTECFDPRCSQSCQGG